MTPPDGDAVASITISPPSLSLAVGGSGTFTATALSAIGGELSGKTFTWTSSNANLASVVAGVVTALSIGSVTVTAMSEGKSQTAAVTITAPGTGQATFSSIAPGGNHTCAITLAGKPYCWGSNQFGQLGIGTPGGLMFTPQAVSGNLTFTAITSGMHHSCGMTAAGATYCWGWNLHGQVGDGTNVDKIVPTLVNAGLSFVTIGAGGSAGGGHSCALTAAGVAYCWGENNWGQLGDGSQTHRSSPVAVSGGLTFASLSVGNFQTCGLIATGRAYCWGDTEYIGIGTVAGNFRGTPTEVAGGLTFASLSSTWWSACGIATNDSTYCWGAYASSTPVLSPTIVQNFVFINISSGNQSTCGVLFGGVGVCWGLNNAGQLGDGTSVTRPTPVNVSGSIAFAKIVVGNGHACGLTAASLAYCWGLNISGQLGDGTQFNKLVPTAVRSP